MEDTENQVELIREVFLYANRFKGKRFVIFIASDLVEDPRFPAVVRDLSLLHQAGIGLIIVPGASQRIDRVLATFGVESKRHLGIRVSSDEAMPLIKMAAFDVANTVMTQLTGQSVDSLIGNWVKARGIGVKDGVDFMNSGQVQGVQHEALLRMLSESYIPILPCIGWSNTGKPYNISSLDLALSISEAVKAEKLFFLTDSVEYAIDNLVMPPDGYSAKEGRITRLTIKGASDVLALNTSLSESLAGDVLKVGARAAKSGVERVHILNGRIDGALLKEVFSTLGQGTMIHTDQFEFIRPMQPHDIPEVISIMEPNIKLGILVQRDEEDLVRLHEDYSVFEADGTVRGCCALHPYGSDQAEIAGLAVNPGYGHLGIGAKLISHAIEQGRQKNLRQIFLLTTQTADYFETLGFERGQITDLPVERQKKVSPNRNSRVYLLPLK